jgi:hypothetical protein
MVSRVGSIRLPASVYGRLVERARVERRSVAGMAALLLERELGTSPGTVLTGPDTQPVDKGAGILPDRPRVDLDTAAAAGQAQPRLSGPVSTRPRTAVCPHRIPAGAYCARCDT